jgi:hypothetical protein
MSLDVDEVLDSARKRLEEWREIQTVIPSLDLHPSVVADLESDEVTLTRDRWRLLTAIDGRRSIRAIARMLMSSDYEVCRSVKALIEVGVVEIDTPSRSLPSAREPRVFVDEGLEQTDTDEAEAGAEAPGQAEETGDGAAEAGTGSVNHPAGTDAAVASGSGSARLPAEAGATAGTWIAGATAPVVIDPGGSVRADVPGDPTSGPAEAGDEGAVGSEGGHAGAATGSDGHADAGTRSDVHGANEENSPDGGAGDPAGPDPSVSAGAQATETPGQKGHRQGVIRIGRRSRPGHGDS